VDVGVVVGLCQSNRQSIILKTSAYHAISFARIDDHLQQKYNKSIGIYSFKRAMIRMHLRLRMQRCRSACKNKTILWYPYI